MKSAIVAASLAAVFGAAMSAAQIAPPPSLEDTRTPVKPGSRAGEYHVITEGCVQGTRLKPLVGVSDPAREFLNAPEWTLHGPRELMQQIRTDYDRYHVEVTGVAVLPQSLEPRDRDVHATRLPDGTRVTFGARRTTTERDTAPGNTAPVRIDVTSVRVLAERCG